MHQQKPKPRIPWREVLLLLAIYAVVVIAATFLFGREG